MISKKSQAKNAIVKGFTSQFITSVIQRPFECFDTFFNDVKSICNIIGKIIAQINILMGIFMFATYKLLMAWMSFLKNKLKKTPRTMHKVTHTLRYLSKRFKTISNAFVFELYD